MEDQRKKERREKMAYPNMVGDYGKARHFRKNVSK